MPINDRIPDTRGRRNGQNTESLPEIDHIWNANGVNRINFYKAILLVTDTGSPVTNIPPIILPNDIKETTKCFVDVNKNPIKLEGVAMVEVKTERSNEKLIIKKNTTEPLLGLNWFEKLVNGLQGSKNTNTISHVIN